MSYILCQVKSVTISVQFSCSVMSDSLQPHGLKHTRPLCITNSWSLLKLMSIELVMPSNHLILCHPLLLLTSIFPSIRVFSNESVLHIRWPKYWSISFSISPFNEYSGLISFRIDWLALLAVQGTLKSLLHNSKASILWHSVVFIVQLSHPHMTTGKPIALSRQTFAGKVMSLLFIMLCRLVIVFSHNLWSNKCQDCYGNDRTTAFMTEPTNTKENISSFSPEKTKNTVVRWSFLFLWFYKDLMSLYCMPTHSLGWLKFYVFKKFEKKFRCKTNFT